MKTFPVSKYAYAFSVLVLCYTSLIFYPKWQKKDTEATISWDASGYYWYLPSIFIYHDLKHQGFKDNILSKYRPTPDNDFQQGSKLESGNYVMKYSSGVAIMETPFFFAGHFSAKLLGYPQDGFSAPYQLAIQLGGLFIAIIGLWFFRKFLLLFFDDIVVAITLLLLVIGSNYLDYAAINVGMSHSWLFTIYVFLLLNTYHFYNKPSFKYAIRIGLLVGLATLTRPTDIISCLIPLLWGMENVWGKELRSKFLFLKTHWKQLAVAIGCASVVVCIQPLYWKYATGHWIVYSYGEQSFSWVHPHVYRYAFDVWNGWLAYTPLMLLAWIGILPYLWHGRNKVMVIAFFLLNYYIVSAWDVWWYGGREVPVIARGIPTDGSFCIFLLPFGVKNKRGVA